MKRMTGMTFLAAVLLGVGTISSCSDSSIDADELTQGGETANVYANISVIVQDNESGGTRAETASTGLEGDYTEKGIEAEATVNKLNIYVFGTDGILKDYTTDVASSYSNRPENGHYTYNSSVVFKNLKYNSGTTYRLYAIANAGNYDIAIANAENNDITKLTIGSTTEASFLKDVVLTAKDGKDWLDYNENSSVYLPMANRAFVADDKDNSAVSDKKYNITYATMVVNADNSMTNPATSEIELERLVAKYTVKVNTNTSTGDASSSVDLKHTVKSNGGTSEETYATINIVKCSPFNLSPSSYAIRHRKTHNLGLTSTSKWDTDFTYCDLTDLSTSADNWDGSTNHWKKADYVLDPLFEKKSKPETVKNDNGLKYWVHSTNRKYFDLSAGQEKNLGYSLENTTLDTCQYMENSTGLMFKAYITPTEIYEKAESGLSKITDTGTKPDTVYYFNYKFYKNVEALYADADEVKNQLPDIRTLNSAYKEPTSTTSTVDGTSVTTYTYNGKEYETQDAANSAFAADKSEELLQRLFQYGVYRYVGETDANNKKVYACYYPYIFKHYVLTNSSSASSLTTAQTTMTPMKFAVVRNNWYQVTVTGIQTIGRPTDEPNPYEPTPDEETEVWLKVNLKVRDWVPRVDSGVTLK